MIKRLRQKIGNNQSCALFLIFLHYENIYVILSNTNCPMQVNKNMIVILGFLASDPYKTVPEIFPKQKEKPLMLIVIKPLA